MDTKALDAKYIAPTYARVGPEIVSGSGALLYDSEGREYIDLCAGIGSAPFGTADPEWTAAVAAQLSKAALVSNLRYSRPRADLAQLLCEKSGLAKVFFANSGAEANECAIKCARKYSGDKYGPDRHVILTLENSFHGRTLTTLSATGQPAMHRDFKPFTQGFEYLPHGDAAALSDRLEKGGVCALMLEIIQGEGGVNPLSAEYVRAAADLCERHDALFIADEVQTGIGRTGRFFSYMHHGVLPDIATSAKGLGGGLPIGAAIFGKKCADTLGPGSHGSTFGGNPAAAAGAKNIVSRIDGAFLSSVFQKGELFRAELAGAPGIKGVRGMGLMLGIDLEIPAGQAVRALLERGVIALTAKERLRLLPPLNIPDGLIKKACGAIREVAEMKISD